MAEIKIQAEPRTEFGKGAARRIRRNDQVPAVLYGHGNEPLHVSLPGHDLMLALKNSNALLSIAVDGDKHLVIPKQVQRDPIKGFIEHADLLLVRRGEKVVVEIPIVVTGEVISGSLVVSEYNTVAVEAEATHIPNDVQVSVEGLEAGAQIHASELSLPTGSELQLEPDTLILHIVAMRSAEDVEADLAEAEAEAGIEHDEAAVEEEPATEGAPAGTES